MFTLTKSGKWLLDAFMAKEVDETDRGLAELIDVLQSAQDHEFAGPEFKWQEDVAVQMGLIERTA